MAPKTTIALLGAKGFVGSAIARAFADHPHFQLLEVVRGDDLGAKITAADLVIHSANSGKRFYANQNPEPDFMDSVEKTATIKNLCRQRKLILISSISARTQLDIPYGRNRRACELIVEAEPNLIVRLGPMYSDDKLTGPLFDLVNNNTVYVGAETEYAYVNVDYIGRRVRDLLTQTGLVELGARDTISLQRIKDAVQSTSTFQGKADHMHPLDPDPEAPEAGAVLAWCVAQKKKQEETS